jgi:hypothetical protein
MKHLFKLFQPDLREKQAEVERQALLNYQKSPAGIAAGYGQEDDLIDEAEIDRQYQLEALRRLRGQ